MRVALVALASFIAFVLACHPKPVTYPSYFDNAYKNQPKPPTCHDVVACYPQCVPYTEQCHMGCEQRAVPADVEHARAAEACFQQAGCADEGCMKTRCGPELDACN